MVKYKSEIEWLRNNIKTRIAEVEKVERDIGEWECDILRALRQDLIDLMRLEIELAIAAPEEDVEQSAPPETYPATPNSPWIDPFQPPWPQKHLWYTDRTIVSSSCIAGPGGSIYQDLQYNFGS